MQNRRNKEKALLVLIYSSILAVVCILLFILFTIFSNGISKLSWNFLTSNTDDHTIVANFEGSQNQFEYQIVEDKKNHIVVEITNVDSESKIVDNIGDNINLTEGTIIETINGQRFDSMTDAQIKSAVEELMAPVEGTQAKLITPGGGIYPLIMTTLFVIFWAIVFSIPVGVFSAIYLIEYDINPRLDRVIHFAIDSLAGIPSIIFGLFGSLFFGIALGFGQSLISGILTVSIMLLPIVIKTVEEALKSVSGTYREASLGLGATKSQTIFKVILPSALPGIMIAIILSVGRVIGESAIFIFTVGTTVMNPNFLNLGNTMLGKGSTLTVYAYNITRENPDYSTAAAIAIIIILIVLTLNIVAKLLSNKLTKGAK